MQQLFTQALGLTSPWSVTSADFSPTEGRIDFAVACEAKRHACPHCGAVDQPIHDRLPRTWRHLNFFQSKAYQAGARKHCPNAQMCFDPYHVVALAHEAIDQVRRAEVKHEPDLKHSRWALLKDPGKWNTKQITKMHYLQRSTLKTVRAWQLKEALRAVFRTATTADEAEADLKASFSWARRSRLSAFKRLGKTLRDHFEGILEHFRTGLSNGFVEAMNGLIRAAIVRAREYGTDRRLITMAYLIGGKLKHLPTNPWIAQHV